MAGTLTISTLSDGTNSTSSTNCIQGSAKAWVNFNGTSGAIRASFNVSSVTRSGTGDYVVNFTNAMSDANYAVVVGSGTGGNNAAQSFGVNESSVIITTTQCRLARFFNSGSWWDSTYNFVSFYR